MVRVTKYDTLLIDGTEVDPRAIIGAIPFSSSNRGIGFLEFVLVGIGCVLIGCTFHDSFYANYYDPLPMHLPWWSWVFIGPPFIVWGIGILIWKQMSGRLPTYGFTLEMPHREVEAKFTSEREAAQFIKDLNILRGSDVPIKKDDGGVLFFWWSS